MLLLNDIAQYQSDRVSMDKTLLSCAHRLVCKTFISTLRITSIMDGNTRSVELFYQLLDEGLVSSLSRLLKVNTLLKRLYCIFFLKMFVDNLP